MEREKPYDHFRPIRQSMENISMTSDPTVPHEESSSVDSSGASHASAASSQEIPPPDFWTLVSMFSTQSMVALGLVPHPTTRKPEVNLPLARHFIDMLGVIETKTKGNLEPQEEKLLTSTLHDLRMIFIDKSRPTETPKG
jgi:hypothetical protein